MQQPASRQGQHEAVLDKLDPLERSLLLQARRRLPDLAAQACVTEHWRRHRSLCSQPSSTSHASRHLAPPRGKAGHRAYRSTEDLRAWLCRNDASSVWPGSASSAAVGCRSRFDETPKPGGTPANKSMGNPAHPELLRQRRRTRPGRAAPTLCCRSGCRRAVSGNPGPAGAMNFQGIGTSVHPNTIPSRPVTIPAESSGRR